jgi:hypothetical protein
VNFAPGFVAPALLTQDLVSQFSAVFGPQWGIFLGGSPVIVAESVTGFEFRNDWTISDYPIEGGVFESYDKVLLPYLAKVRFASGSSPTARAELLSSVAAAAQTLSLYDVVTPEFTYLSCNISHYDYRRSANQGVGLIVVDVWVSQVLIQNAGGLSAASVTAPSGADAVSGGSVSPTGGGTGPTAQITPPVDSTEPQ